MLYSFKLFMNDKERERYLFVYIQICFILLIQKVYELQNYSYRFCILFFCYGVIRVLLMDIFFGCRGGKIRVGVRVYLDDGGGGVGYDELVGYLDFQGGF